MVAAQSEVVTVLGEMKKWQPITFQFLGPIAYEISNEINPFLDYRLQLLLISPTGHSYNVPGYFAGDGQGDGFGNVWQVRFHADEAGEWHYRASFRTGLNVAIMTEENAGTPTHFDGSTGSFTITETDPNAPGFLKWGRLEYVGSHYLKFREGPYWLKGGTNSPENFFAYQGFDNTTDQGGILSNFLHSYSPHVADWQAGDPDFLSADSGIDGKGIIGALNYLGSQSVNAIYFLPMNLGGDGQDTYPFLYAGGRSYGNTHYDISKLAQWEIVLNHAQQQGVAGQIVLGETETENRKWLDSGNLRLERRLFYREMVARFGYLLALSWNLSEENSFLPHEVEALADYIRALDWADHPITFHTPANVLDGFEPLLGKEGWVMMSIQCEADLADEYVEEWFWRSQNAGTPWVINVDEIAHIGLSDTNADELRKRVLYDVYLSGGNLEWYAGYFDLPLGGDVNLEDFGTRQAMWEYSRIARQFMEQNLPFWEMVPADDLLTGEAELFGGGQVFALPQRVYAVYLPDASLGGVLDLRADAGIFTLRWFNPRQGNFMGESQTITVGQPINLGVPPDSPQEDWLVLLQSNLPFPTTTPTPLPTFTPVPSATPLLFTSTFVPTVIHENVTPTPPLATPTLPTLLPTVPTYLSSPRNLPFEKGVIAISGIFLFGLGYWFGRQITKRG